MAGVSGFVLGATIGDITPTLGFSFLLVVFAAVVVGGVGKAYGAMVGALIIGMVEEIGALYIPGDYRTSPSIRRADCGANCSATGCVKTIRTVAL